jgi:CheY-like chemotaxis protein
MAGSRDQCLDAGMDDYMTKPLRLEDLTEAIRKWFPQCDAASVLSLKAS